MEYEILKPICVGCGKEIDKPSDTNMEAFRFGLVAHSSCISIHENIESVLRKLGVKG